MNARLYPSYAIFLTMRDQYLEEKDSTGYYHVKLFNSESEAVEVMSDGNYNGYVVDMLDNE